MHLLIKRYLDVYAVTSEIWFRFYLMSEKKPIFYILNLFINLQYVHNLKYVLYIFVVFIVSVVIWSK